MKRSYNTSFVNHVNHCNENHISTPSHSFQQNATLATHYNNTGHSVYYPNSGSVYTRNHPSSPFYNTPAHDQPRYTPRRAPLTGLGISLNNGFGLDSPTLSSVSMPVSMPLRIPMSTYLAGTYSPFVNDSFGYSPYQDSFIQDDWLTSNRNSEPSLSADVMQESGAYSACPADEYCAPSPVEDDGFPLLASLSRDAPLCFRSPYQPMELEEAIDFSPESDDMMVSPVFKVQHETPMIGLFADVNFREQQWAQIQPEATVDPSLLVGNDNDDVPMDEDEDEEPVLEKGPQAIIEELQFSELPTCVSSISQAEETTALDTAVTAIVSVLSASMDNENSAEQSTTPATAAAPESVAGPSAKKQKLSQYMNDQGLAMPAFATRTIKREVLATPNISSPMTVLPARTTLGDVTTLANNMVSHGPVVMGSPVLNAHSGISLDDLRRKADEYRTNNHCDIDKNWLQAFAGRLSQQGQLMNEFRCYVDGCNQTNRRRDHILVHVGSHVEHRPFSCLICGMRFLRNNECKRHATSHSGAKPYVCEVCPPERSRAFVRQDLLKRHLKVTHRMGTTRKPRGKKENCENDFYEAFANGGIASPAV